MSETKTGKIIDVAKILVPHVGTRYLLLRKLEPHGFEWFLDNGEKEAATGVVADSLAASYQEGFKKFKMNSFRPVIAGFRYSLPERDEHGINATFSQMAKSYTSSNGVYFDEDAGHNCFVQNASLEALNLFKLYKLQGRLETPL